MLRRSFLSRLSALPLLGLLVTSPKSIAAQCDEEICKTCGSLGKALEMTLTNDINLSYCGTLGEIPSFPIETTLEITYEHGIEMWKALNVNMKDFVDITLKSFFAEYVIIPDKFVPTLQWRQYKFKLSYISLEDKNT